MAGEDTLFRRFGREFKPGDVLFREGDSGSEMYVIQGGKVRISRDIQGEDKALALLGPGEFFGEMAILNHKPRGATATVVEPAKLLVLDGKTFETMIVSNTEIAVRLIRKLAQRLDAADALIEILLHKDSRSRVVLGLSRLAEQSGQKEGEAIVVRTTEQDLSDQVGVDVPTVHEVLDRLGRVGVIRRRTDGEYLIDDPGRLREFLEFLEMRNSAGVV